MAHSSPAPTRRTGRRTLRGLQMRQVRNLLAILFKKRYWAARSTALQPDSCRPGTPRLLVKLNSLGYCIALVRAECMTVMYLY